METAIEISGKTLRFHAEANVLLRNFRYCSREVKYVLLYRLICTNVLLIFIRIKRLKYNYDKTIVMIFIHFHILPNLASGLFISIQFLYLSLFYKMVIICEQY